MKKLYFSLFFVFCLLLAVACFAQNGAGPAEKPEMATGLRSNGKIYVVVVVVVTILLGFTFYLFSLDRKIRRLETESKAANRGNP